ncbi:MAG: flagellar motor switch protein FliN/FliY [Rhodospirillaceae bacterium]|nr:MAG: flagellar motor switch protein FliN/FliY [Rhodospirillaceae bacterium]
MVSERPESREERKTAYAVTVEIAVILSKATLRVHQLLELVRGTVVELEQKASEPVEVYTSDRLVGYGQAIVTEGNRLGVNLTHLVKASDIKRIV